MQTFIICIFIFLSLVSDRGAARRGCSAVRCSRQEREQVIADPLSLDCADYFYAFRYVKENVQL